VESTDTPEKARPRLGYRWWICALLFFATTINYVDRSVMSVLAPELKKTIQWDDAQFGYINAAFPLAYAIGFLMVGWLLDRFGTRFVYAWSLLLWSLAAMAHALARTPTGFMAARFFLGLTESGNFPSAIKATAEWFPRSERALATGLFNAGSNVGAVLAPALVPIIYANWGWQAAFVATGIVGLIWIAFWLPAYRRPQEHPSVTAEELAWIQSEPPEPTTKIPWRQLLPHRQTWAFALGKFLTDSVWWFYLFWFPTFMNDTFQVDIKGIGLPMITVYLMADVGSIAGGWLSSSMLKRGYSANVARKTAMLACALCVIPVSLAPVVGNQWSSVLLIGVATAAHQGFSANLFTLTSDMFPKRAVGSVVGIGGFAGAMGGFFLQLASGNLKQITGSYLVLFIIAAAAYLTALLIIHLLVPRLEPVVIDDGQGGQPRVITG
jgi:ACS family hexuronate transporter-like MFS transporter